MYALVSKVRTHSCIVPVYAVIEHTLRTAEATPHGCFVEVGVYKGGSALGLYAVAQHQGRDLHLFDTYCGIPYQDEGDFCTTEMFRDANLNWQRQNIPEAHFHIGVFPETLPDDLHNIAFAHVDCDQYRSITACIDHLWPRMVPGGVMWFGINYPELHSARKAIRDRFSDDELQPTIFGDSRFVRRTFDGQN